MELSLLLLNPRPRMAGASAEGPAHDGTRTCGAHERNRTFDLLLTKEVLYRLSYVSVETGCCTGRRGWRNGAGDGNRTRASSLEGYSSTIELLPRRAELYRVWNWWREVDSNHRRRKPADLQSAPVGRLGIPPNISPEGRERPSKEPVILTAAFRAVNGQARNFPDRPIGKPTNRQAGDGRTRR